MLYIKCRIIKSARLTGNISLLRLDLGVRLNAEAGQFLNFYFNGAILPRPFTIFEEHDEFVDVLVKNRGEFSNKLCELSLASEIYILGPSGSGLPSPSLDNCLISGGIGLASFKKLVDYNETSKFELFSFFSEKEELKLMEYFRGSNILQNAVIDDNRDKMIKFFKQKDFSRYEKIYICVPKQVYKSVWDYIPSSAMVSFDERIGCGLGSCLGCTIITKSGQKKICKDGPFLQKGEILYV